MTILNKITIERATTKHNLHFEFETVNDLNKSKSVIESIKDIYTRVIINIIFVYFNPYKQEMLYLTMVAHHLNVNNGVNDRP